MKLIVKDQQGRETGELEVQFPILENRKGTQAVHEAVVAYRAAQRHGTACTKTMGEVAGTGKKPWRQKGTGRARAGSFASPLWRGGGVVFGPKPRDYDKRLTKSTKHLAMRKAISSRLQAGDIVVVEELAVAAPKTKEMVRLLGVLQLKGSVLVVTQDVNPNLVLSARNLPGVELASCQSLNTYQVLRCDKLLFTRSAFNQLEQRLMN
jgi:large subunit ribosomal protein L4